MAEETTTEKKVVTRKIKGDPVIWGVFIMLCIISIIEVFSASSNFKVCSSFH